MLYPLRAIWYSIVRYRTWPVSRYPKLRYGHLFSIRFWFPEPVYLHLMGQC